MTSSVLSPVDMVIFGALGDLARRKIWPALYYRYHEGQLDPASRLIAMERNPLSAEEMLHSIRDACHAQVEAGEWSEEGWNSFAQAIHTLAGSMEKLPAILQEQPRPIRAFYLATPPQAFGPLCQQLKALDVITPSSRVVLEKPLGEDRASFRRMNEDVRECFSESQIYRIDHYLGKETVQNLMILRFANPLFARIWDRTTVDHVQITVAETLGVEHRAPYYDKAGCLRDMVQNHLLQLLCLVAMEPPGKIDPDAVRHEKLKVLQALRPLTKQQVEDTVRGQYTAGGGMSGYAEEVGNAATRTETFTALKLWVDNWRWSGVPFYLRTGKRMAQRYSEIVLHFRPVPHDLFPGSHHTPEANQLIIRLQPDESVKLRMVTKTPGPGGYRLHPVHLNLSLTETFPGRIPDAYERLLMDVIRGNPTLFMHSDEVDAAWEFTDGILAAWEQDGGEPLPYAAGSQGPRAASDLLTRDGRSWHVPGV